MREVEMLNLLVDHQQEKDMTETAIVVIAIVVISVIWMWVKSRRGGGQ